MGQWFVTWASEVIQMYHLRGDGWTAYEQMAGQLVKHFVIGFWEKVPSLFARDNTHQTCMKDIDRKGSLPG